MTKAVPQRAWPGPKPLIGVLCCNEMAERPVQTVASRFIDPLVRLSGATVMLVPALVGATDAAEIAVRLDGLLLTGSRSNVAAHRYGGRPGIFSRPDEERDEIALRLSDAMINAGRPVFGICRGLQELNVLFGGSLRDMPAGTHHLDLGEELAFFKLFGHMHDVDLTPGGRLTVPGSEGRISVNSVHTQGIDRLGDGLTVEAVATQDGIVEAISARGCDSEVLGVQWHPEWNGAQCAVSQRFFAIIGEALRRGTQRGQAAA